MRRKLTAWLTLLIFVGGIGLPGMAAVAAPQSDGKSYTTYDNTPALPSGGEAVDGMKELRVKNGSEAGVLAYSLNASRQLPSAQGVSGYKKLSGTVNQDWAAAVDKALNPSSVKQDVLNVIWNGYPYLAGTWKGASDFAKLAQSGSLSSAAVSQLSNLAVTQQAIWRLTDSRAVSGAAAADVNALLAAAQKNPAPANFSLDLYDGSAAKSASGQKMTNLVAASAAQQKVVTVKVNHRWLDKNGNVLSGVKTPSLSFALYAADAAAGAQPVATYNMNDATGTLAFALFDDEQNYRLQPVLSGATEGFTPDEAKTITLKGSQGDVLQYDFVTTYQAANAPEDPEPASVPLGAEVTLDGKTPEDGVFTFLLKDEAGTVLQTKTNIGSKVTFDPLSFDKEGSYNYTISMQAGSDSGIAYDKAVYKVRVSVDRGENYSAAVSYEKDGIVYTGVPVFSGQKVTTPSDDKETTSVTVNKVWKNDKSSDRPSSVKMQLYRDGKAYGSTVTLNADNGWKYTWSGLDASYKWTVNELNVPSGYTKTESNSGNTWTITNTKKSSTSTASTNKTSSTASKTSSTDKSKSSNRSTPETGDDSNLNLWTTIAIIALSGMVLIAAVWLLSDRRRLRGKK